MNFVSRNGSSVVIKQVPFLLLFVAGLFSLPIVASSLLDFSGGTDAVGNIFRLFLGLFVLWICLEFVATRERIDIDLDGKVLKRKVSGVFRNKEQVIDLRDIQGIGLEIKPGGRSRHQYLYMYGSNETFLVNSPSKVYIDHSKLGSVLSEVTRIPYFGEKKSY